MIDFPKIKTSIFICNGWLCPKCGYQGNVEVHTLGIGLPDVKYQVGDPIAESVVGNKEHFDAFLCPSCVDRMDYTLYGVTLHISNGHYSGSFF